MDAQVVASFSQVVGQLGFPIFVAVWMLVKGSRDNEAIVKALTSLETAIKLLEQKIGGNQ